MKDWVWVLVLYAVVVAGALAVIETFEREDSCTSETGCELPAEWLSA